MHKQLIEFSKSRHIYVTYLAFLVHCDWILDTDSQTRTSCLQKANVERSCTVDYLYKTVLSAYQEKWSLRRALDWYKLNQLRSVPPRRHQPNYVSRSNTLSAPLKIAVYY